MKKLCVQHLGKNSYLRADFFLEIIRNTYRSGRDVKQNAHMIFDDSCELFERK